MNCFPQLGKTSYLAESPGLNIQIYLWIWECGITESKDSNILMANEIVKALLGNFLVIQWLGLQAFTAKDVGSTPGWGTTILKAMQCSQRKKKNASLHVISPSALFYYYCFLQPSSIRQKKRLHIKYICILIYLPILLS